MNVQRPTFMLLPDFGFAPGQDIHLGTLLLLNSETKLPDPDEPLNAGDRVVTPEAQVKRHTEQSWKFDNSTQSCWSAGVDAEVPVFLPAGGGLGYGVESKQTLTIECEQLHTERFVPSPTYLVEALATDFVQAYCQKRWRPSVYLVTGLKIAKNATISSASSRSHDGNIKAKLDGTSFGVPLNAGPSAQASDAAAKGTAKYIEGPFVLAYQLKRLRLSSKGAVKSSEGFNKFALFDDQTQMEGSELLDSWNMEDVQPDTMHDS